MTPSVGWRAVALNGLKFFAVMSPAATVMEASLLPAGWSPAAAPEQAASMTEAVAAAARPTRRRVLVRCIGFRSIVEVLSGHGHPHDGGGAKASPSAARSTGDEAVKLCDRVT